MTFLPCRVGARQYWAGLPQAEVELSEQTLALPHTELDSIRFLDPRRQCLAIPQIHPHSGVARFGSQHPIDLLDLFFVQPARPTGPLSLGQSGR
jgi:hypothetical protein